MGIFVWKYRYKKSLINYEYEVISLLGTINISESASFYFAYRLSNIAVGLDKISPPVIPINTDKNTK